jgi:endonuclease G
VLADGDPVYRDVPIPLAFWKAVATVDDEGALHATAYVLSQEELIEDFRPEVDGDGVGPVLGPYRTFQVPVADLEAVVQLDLGPLRDADPLRDEDRRGPAEVAVTGGGGHEITSYADVVLR